MFLQSRDYDLLNLRDIMYSSDVSVIERSSRVPEVKISCIFVLLFLIITCKPLKTDLL